MCCVERKRLIALHLKAIAEWKDAVKSGFTASDQPEAQRAWRRALEAERAIFDHSQQHDCGTAEPKLRAVEI
jgi:hypothetical protein